jgi:hypothetical protein
MFASDKKFYRLPLTFGNECSIMHPSDYICNQMCKKLIKEIAVSLTYLTTDELSSLIKYDPRTIRERLKDSVLLEGVHYIRPFGGRKILYIWEKIEADMGCMVPQTFAIPMANGGVCHG